MEKVIVPPVSPRPVMTSDNQWLIGFPAQDGETLARFIIDQTQFARQSYVNLEYYKSCIAGFNGG